jgi:large subunit ribosomal protein L25
LGGESYRCIIKEIQFHPVTEGILHIDFLELAEGRKVKVQLPVRFKGTSPGVRNGGRLIQQLRKVEIKTTPDQLVEELILDISNLKLGNSVRVRDIETNDEIEILTNPGIPVATVKVPRVVIEEEEVVPGEVEGEEGAEEGEAGGEPKGEESSSGE